MTNTPQSRETPLISVYLPTYNRSLWLRESVASVQQQSYSNFELLIVDDGSTDDTPQLLETLERADPRIRAHRNERPVGAAAARNQALAMARGPWCTGLDDDDLMLPDRLSELMAARDPTYSLLCTAFWLEREGIRRCRHRAPRIVTLDQLLHYNVIGNQALMQTDHVRAIGGFDETLPASQDYDLWTRMVTTYGPAKRIASASYVMRDHRAAAGRISHSPAAIAGAAQYRQKHAPLMARRHHRSQNLIAKIIGREPIRFRDLPHCFAWSSLPLLVRYLGSRLKARWPLR